MSGLTAHMRVLLMVTNRKRRGLDIYATFLALARTLCQSRTLWSKSPVEKRKTARQRGEKSSAGGEVIKNSDEIEDSKTVEFGSFT